MAQRKEDILFTLEDALGTSTEPNPFILSVLSYSTFTKYCLNKNNELPFTKRGFVNGSSLFLLRQYFSVMV